MEHKGHASLLWASWMRGEELFRGEMFRADGVPQVERLAQMWQERSRQSMAMTSLGAVADGQGNTDTGGAASSGLATRCPRPHGVFWSFPPPMFQGKLFSCGFVLVRVKKDECMCSSSVFVPTSSDLNLSRLNL